MSICPRPMCPTEVLGYCVPWTKSSLANGGYLANFLSISLNQTKFVLTVCLVPRLDFSAIPVSISAISLGRLSTYILFRF
jgi:hypothetical protein